MTVRNFPTGSVVIRGVEARSSDKTARPDPLAARLADGDPLAPKVLVERHYAELYRYAFSVLREEQAAEDAVQDAFERAFAALGRYPEGRLRAMKLRPWKPPACVITRSRSRDACRRWRTCARCGGYGGSSGGNGSRSSTPIR